ncbi:hypothetical protein BDR03DRAFT_275509 [Suillus americanus]|nr:hypothetical protein BDR03DRAFT_275509 [Suillus americanus]
MACLLLFFSLPTTCPRCLSDPRSPHCLPAESEAARPPSQLTSALSQGRYQGFHPKKLFVSVQQTFPFVLATTIKTAGRQQTSLGVTNSMTLEL